eukprot:m.253173 g.253173  ORF g.253173 m.253173 type:complete len:287 (-) comp18181_c0_seq1:144-1004(-)
MEGFDDSLFEEHVEKKPAAPVLEAYIPRHLEPKWFHAENRDLRGITEHDALRFSSDMHYRDGQYEKALAVALQALDQLQGNESQVQRNKEWRDIAARCHLQLGQLDDALHRALERAAMDHASDAQGRRLAAEVRVARGEFIEAAALLQQCLAIQHSNPRFWLLLATCYRALQPAQVFSLLDRACHIWARAWAHVASNASKGFARQAHLKTIISIDDTLLQRWPEHPEPTDAALAGIAAQLETLLPSHAIAISMLEPFVTQTFTRPVPLPIDESAVAEPAPADKGER